MPPNRLIHEPSPYLQQHAHNPVDWFPWAEEAFAKARIEGKPIFLSSGYSTCHWCHVMERESFENEAIAGILNQRFVAIKLDREERPDVDRVYMTFVQASSGSGGWPMSVFLTPELKPFYGGTYFPPDSRYGRPGFSALLLQIAEAWRRDRPAIEAAGLRLVSELESYADVRAAAAGPAEAGLASAFAALRREFDATWGGFGAAPKFPRPSTLHFLFRYYARTGEAEAREMALSTLRAMARGGLHDHLGGGFHRYSVDERWHVPHFEKMLYDQAQLATAYLEAYQITGEAEYARVARGVLDYILGDLQHPGGGFYSAEDADSATDPARPADKAEGAFYVWESAELGALLGAQADEFARVFACRPEGNVDNDPHGELSGKNVLLLSSELPAAWNAWRDTLLAARALRPRPQRDDKILTGWNGLAISALARASRVLSEPRYLEAARSAARFLAAELDRAGLLRRWCRGHAAIDALLDDYAALAQAHLDLYEASFDAAELERAGDLARRMIERFEDRAGGGFFSSPASSADLLLRLKDDYDGAEPAANSLAAGVLARLSAYTGDAGFGRALEATFAAFGSRLARQPVTLPQMLCAWMQARSPHSQARFEGDSATLVAAFNRAYKPFTTLVWQPAAEASATLCDDFVCQPRTSDAAAWAKLLG